MDQSISPVKKTLTPEQIEAAKARLSEYDYIFVIDKSGSMTTDDMPGGRSRWAACQESVLALAREINKVDTDGVGLVMFSDSSIIAKDGVKPIDIELAFQTTKPGGGTPLDQGLREAFKLAGKSGKKDFIIVVTDGEPNDSAATLEVIRQQANSQDKDEDCTVLFMQIGYDQRATTYLKTLDDNIPGAKFDIVDVKTMAEVDQYPSSVELILDAISG